MGVMDDTSSGAAAKFIKTDKNNHQNLVLNWDFFVYYSYVVLLCNGADILEEDGWSPEGDACQFPSLLTSFSTQSSLGYYDPVETLICFCPTINSCHVY